MVIFLTVFHTTRIRTSGLIRQDCQWADQIPIKKQANSEAQAILKSVLNWARQMFAARDRIVDPNAARL
jgi:hypothetical protein